MTKRTHDGGAGSARQYEAPPLGGRQPIFYAHEVDEIRADKRSSAVVADEWGVSYDTIQRVRQRGRFRGVPYVTKEQASLRRKYPPLFSTEPVEEWQPPKPDAFTTTKPNPVGRKFSSGRAPLTLDEIAAILVDKRPTRAIARDYHLQSNYVQKLKRDYATEDDLKERIERCRDAVLADDRDVKTLSMAYKLPRGVIERIKHGTDTAEEKHT